MIKLSKQAIEAAQQRTDGDLIEAITNVYLRELGGELTAENMDKLNFSQHTLLAYRFLSDEINEGGFVQLIQNGYGSYIFGNPVAKSLKLFGAKDASKLIYKAREIYEVNKADLERETTDEEFMEMYVNYEVFDDLEEAFFMMEESQTSAIEQYILKNIEQFVGVD